MGDRVLDWLFAALLLAAAVMIAFFSTRFGCQHDFSYAQRASLDSRTRTLLEKLGAPIAIVSYAPPDNQLRSAISDFVARYERIKPDISLNFVDPDANPAATREAGIQVNGELVIRYKGRSEQLKVLTERELDNALLRLAREHERLVAFLGGDGERKADGVANSDFGNFGALLKAQGIRAIPLTLAGNVHVPENVDALVIAAPSVPLNDAVVKELLDYVERGGNLLWLIEPNVATNLDALLKVMSLRVLPGVAVDGAGSQFGIGDPSFIAITQYPANPITRGFALTTLFPQSAALAKIDDTQWNTSALLNTTAKSWTETGEIPKQGDTTTIAYDEKKGEIPGPLNIGLSMTRLSPSPAKREQRAVAIGDADFLSNAFLGNGGNREFGQRVFDWLLQDDELVDIPDKGAPDRRLDITQQQLGAIGIGFLVVLPALLLIVGGVIWRRRRRA